MIWASLSFKEAQSQAFSGLCFSLNATFNLLKVKGLILKESIKYKEYPGQASTGGYYIVTYCK